MIVVDPRFTRTAAVADLFCQIRAGSDIAFLGGMINYAIENNRVAKDYLVNYTNAAFIIKEGFKLPEDGLFSGFDPATKTYDKSSLELPGRRQRDRQGRADIGGGSATAAQGHARSIRRLARQCSGHPLKAGLSGPGPVCAKASARPHSSAVASAQYRLRPVAATSALRLSTFETAVLPLYARDGGAHHRDTERPVPEGC